VIPSFAITENARLVNGDPHEKISRIHAARSSDGLLVDISEEPVLAPGPDREDAQGVEDPTLSAGADETAVYSSGWNRATDRTRCCRLARASRRRTNAASQSAIVRRANPKEVTLARASEGSWETNAIELLADRASGIPFRE
jgi:predicted GH43/DUF377 family glycosyl hydrolase